MASSATLLSTTAGFPAQIPVQPVVRKVVPLEQPVRVGTSLASSGDIVARKAETGLDSSSVVLSDEQLFARAAKGGQAELGELITRYEDFLYGLIVRLTNGDTHRAEDFFQEAFLHAIKRAQTFDPKKSFKPWISAIALNLVRDDARKRKVRSEVAIDSGSDDGEPGYGVPNLADEGEGPGETAERKDEEQKVRRALERLTDLEREVVLLHFYNGMTLQETADALESPLGTIKSRLHAALSRLSGLLGRGRQ